MTTSEILANREVTTRDKRLQWILYFNYAQIVFLALTYLLGVWLGTEVHNSTITTPEFIVHGLLASTFSLLSAIVGFLALLENERKVGFLNLFLFFITVLAGASGFAFLGNNSSANQILQTNLSMMATIAIAMPVTAYTLNKNLSLTRTAKSSITTFLAYFALASLSLTVLAGAAVESIALYPFAIVVHVGLAALTISVVLGIVVLSVLEGSSMDKLETRSWVPQRVLYSLLGLAAVAIAGGDGVVTVTVGGVSYVVVMAELTVLVYAFLILSIMAPIRLDSFHLRNYFKQRVTS